MIFKLFLVVVFCGTLSAKPKRGNDNPGATMLNKYGFQEDNTRIGAFNIQILGDAKVANEEVVEQLIKILKRYDIVLVQEIRDVDGSAWPELFDKIVDSTKLPLGYIISDKFGRSNSKENYAYMFRTDKYTAEPVDYIKGNMDHWQGNKHASPPQPGMFERPPFVAKFTSNIAAISEFLAIGIHTKPSDAVNEISRLADVYDLVSDQERIKDAIIMGDFNADCSYVTATKWNKISLWTDKRFTWLNSNEYDTTVSASDCAYDRMVIVGDQMKAALIPNTTRVFNYPKEYGLSEELAKAVSDHYPLETMLYGKVDIDRVRADLRQGFTVNAQTGSVLDDGILTALRRCKYDVQKANIEGSKLFYAVIEKETTSPGYIMRRLKRCMDKAHKDFIPKSSVALVETAVDDLRLTEKLSHVPSMEPNEDKGKETVRVTFTGQTMSIQVMKDIFP